MFVISLHIVCIYIWHTPSHVLYAEIKNMAMEIQGNEKKCLRGNKKEMSLKNLAFQTIRYKLFYIL